MTDAWEGAAEDVDVEVLPPEEALRLTDVPMTDRGVLNQLCPEPGYVIPEEYTLEERGITWWHPARRGTQNQVLIDDRIAGRPFIVTKWLKDDLGGNRYELTWLTANGEVRSVIADAHGASDKAGLVKAFPEFVVTSVHASSCVLYLQRLLEENREWLVHRAEDVATALGWPVDGLGVFTSGPERPRIVDDVKKTGPWLEGHREGGTLRGWKEAVEATADRPLIQVQVAAALAAPLLRVLGAPSFVLDTSGTTSLGKTTSMRLAAAAWGEPDQIMLSWKNTRVATEHYLGAVRGMPLFMNESQLAEQATVEDVIYSLVEGRSKGRSDQRGAGLIKTTRYEAIMLSNGEQPLTAITKKGGTVPRTVTQTGVPCADGRQADAVNDAAREHHGLAGPAFVQAVVGMRAERVREAYERWRVRLIDLTDGPVARRRADSVAVLALANELAAGGGLELMPRMEMETWAWLLDGGGAATGDEDDRARAALRDIMTWAAANMGRFMNKSSPYPDGTSPTGGWLGRWEEGEWISFDPEQLRKKLIELGYDETRVKMDWRDRGWMKHQPKKYTYPVRMSKSATVRHVIVTNLEDLTDEVGVEAVGEMGDERMRWPSVTG